MIEQSDNDSETSDQLPPIFVAEGRKAAAQQDEDDKSIIPLNAPDEGAPPNIPFVESDDALVASDDASVANSYSPNEPDPGHLHQSKQIWECQSGHLCQTKIITSTFGPKKIPIHATKLTH